MSNILSLQTKMLSILLECFPVKIFYQKSKKKIKLCFITYIKLITIKHEDTSDSFF